MFSKQNLKIILGLFLGGVTLAIIFLLLWSKSIEHEIVERLERGWFKAPIEFYSQQEKFYPGRYIRHKEMEKALKLAGYLPAAKSLLKSQEFIWWPVDACQMNLAEKLPDDTQKCLAFRPKDEQHLKVLAFAKPAKIIATYQGEPLKQVDKITLAPYMFAQYYGDQPIMRQILKLSDVPLYCAQAVTAIEDKNFLQHKGFSPLGFTRAILKNLISGYYAQGGSTITQQLVKNYFLSPEKTIRRKLTEILMSIILETKFSKEQILENYLNVIYLGQNGPFQVRGFGAAAIHYLNKQLADLDLAECALLAAVLNNPGRYNPYRNPDKALQRRTIVLQQMFQQNMIDAEQLAKANHRPLPSKEQHLAIAPAPYYVDAVFKKLQQMNFLPKYSEAGLKVYTYLNLEDQELAQKTLATSIEYLEQQNKKIKTLKSDGQELQGLLIHVDLETGGICSFIGGKSFSLSQYNRALDSHRQVGSIFKPLVYLAALESQTPEGLPYTPLTIISDDPLTYKYEGQVWQPQNYSKINHGEIPMYYALKNSINIATARLGVSIGLEHVIDVARRMGMTSEIYAVPSLTLGAFEMKPLEVAQIYAGIARMGSVPDLHLINKIEHLNGELLYEALQHESQQVAAEKIAQLISMMKLTLKSGTARAAKKWGFVHTAAGKTGTTSDTKDAWFAGFTPKDLVITWVGYDNNTVSELTGASGALPMWAQYMKKVSAKYEDQDFQWPANLHKKMITYDENKNWLKKPNEDEKLAFELLVE